MASPAAVPRRSLKRASQVLTALPDKPPEPIREWSIREAIALLQDVILATLDKGYSQEDVAALLNQVGIPVSPPSLRYYLTRLKQSAQPKAAASRAKSTRTPKSKKRIQSTAAASAIKESDAATRTSTAADRPAANRSVENVIAYLLDEAETPKPAAEMAADAELPASKQKLKKRKR
ncbi:MAG: hypothetical protein OHK0037_10630 [Elainellaceae cyanobacterium]